MSGQEEFVKALLAQEVYVPENVRLTRKKTLPLKRFSVYRNNVLTSLVALLSESFPITRRLVGENFFRSMTQIYARQDPPRSPVLMNYGESLPSFIATFEQAKDLPYLADVARLEIAQRKAYYAADVEPLSPEKLSQALEKHALTDCSVAFHPSASRLASLYPIMQIWEMNQEGATLGPIEKWRAEMVLIWRRDYSTRVKEFSPQDALFIECLFKKETLGAALEAAMQSGSFNPDGVIAFLVSEGLLVNLLPQKMISEKKC